MYLQHIHLSQTISNSPNTTEERGGCILSGKVFSNAVQDIERKLKGMISEKLVLQVVLASNFGNSEAIICYKSVCYKSCKSVHVQAFWKHCSHTSSV